MKLFTSVNIDVINECRSCFNFQLPNKMTVHRKEKFEAKFINFNRLTVCYISLAYMLTVVNANYRN